MPKNLFTSETARAAQVKAEESKRRKKAAREQERLAEERRIQESLENPRPADEYLKTRIARIRAALDRYDQLLLTETDPQKAQWLATVVSKLGEQERILCGRPMPGQLRPNTPSRRSATPAPLIPE